MKPQQPYVCKVCDYIYDPERGEPKNGIPPGTAFADLPDTYTCPVCGQAKSAFMPLEASSGRYRCLVCGYLYNPVRGEPKNGIAAGTAFADLPERYVCPVCGVYARVGRTTFVPTE